MLSLVFEQLNGEKIILPVMETAFKETKNEDGTFIIAYFNNEKFELRGSVMDIQRMCAMAMQPPPQMDFKQSLRGF